MTGPSRHWLEQLQLGVDLASIAAASYVATSPQLVAPQPGHASLVFLGTALVSVLGRRVLKHDDLSRSQGLAADMLLRLILVSGVSIVLLLGRRLGVPWYLSVLGFATILLPLAVISRLFVDAQSRTTWLEPEVLIIGASASARHTAVALIRDERRPRPVGGFIALPDEEPHPRLPAPVLSDLSHLSETLGQRSFGEVFIAANSARHPREVQEAIQVCERFGIPFALPVTQFRLGRARPVGRDSRDGYIHFVSIQVKPVQLALKRFIDVVVSATALFLLSPLLLTVAALVKLTSKGPILFRQERVGLYGQRFFMLKFRSMVVDAEALKAALEAKNEQTGPVFKIKNDPRITTLGRFIRKYSIDELPQLINVLRGEMSLVGPRPPIPSEVARYEAWQRRRLSMRPGLTCIWQVSGRNEISFEDWMVLDMTYIDNWRLWVDLELMVRTVPVVLFGRGAS